MFINTTLSKLTDRLSCFPLGHVLDMTVDLTFQRRPLRWGMYAFCVNLHLRLCVLIGSRQSKK